MNITDLHLEADKDLYLNEDNISRKSCSSGVTINKWLRYYKVCAAELQDKKSKKDQIELLLYLYYTGKASNDQLKVLGKERPFGLKIDTKSDIDRFIKASKEYINIDKEVKETERELNYIDEVIQALKTQNYKITNIINYMKFMNGE